MKAIRVHEFGEPDVMELVDTPDLAAKGAQLKIAVKAIGVNPVDSYIRSGIYPIKPELPYTPGLDASGVIIEIGPDVKHKKIGERVYVFGSQTGCYAEQLVCEEDQAYLLPAGIDFSAGAALGVPYSTAFYALNYRARALPGETLLIHGASGAVGLAAIQIARASGLRVIGTAGTQQGLELIKAQGVLAALNHTEENYLAPVNELTCGTGVDVILEMLANINLDKDLKLLAKSGRVVIIGSRGTVEINPRDTMGKNSAILGMTILNAEKKHLRQIHAVIKAGLSDGRYKPIIRKELSLHEASIAHKLVMETGGCGKIVLIP